MIKIKSNKHAGIKWNSICDIQNTYMFFVSTRNGFQMDFFGESVKLYFFTNRLYIETKDVGFMVVLP